MNAGSNNQFRINIMFPEYDKGKHAGGGFITMMSANDYALWFEHVILQAMWRVTSTCPPDLKDASIRLESSLPKTYSLAESRAKGRGQRQRSFNGHKVRPELIN